MSQQKDQGQRKQLSPRGPSPEKSPPRVSFNEDQIREQARAAETRKAALRPKEEPTPQKGVAKGSKGGGQNQTPTGGGYWRKKRKKWRKQARGKGKRKGEEGRLQLRSRSPQSRDEVSSCKVRELMAWLRENAGENLTAAQMAQYTVLQAVTLNALQEQGVRNRNLMPPAPLA